MSKFTLYSIDDEMGLEEIVKMQFEEVRLEALLEKLDRFIKAAGFAPKGKLEYVEKAMAEDSAILQRKLDSIERRVEDARIDVQSGRLDKEEVEELLHKILTDIYA